MLVVLLVVSAMFLAGCLCLLHVRRVEAEHRERMAEIAAARARQADEIEQWRGVRYDPPTEVMVRAEPEPTVERQWPAGLGSDGADRRRRHRLQTTL
jgi:hypothetical protein